MKTFKNKYIIIGLVILGLLSFKNSPNKDRFNSKRIEKYLTIKLDVSEENAQKISLMLSEIEIEKKKIDQFNKSFQDFVTKDFVSENFAKEKIQKTSVENRTKIDVSTNIILDKMEKIHFLLNTNQRKKIATHLSKHKTHKHKKH